MAATNQALIVPPPSPVAQTNDIRAIKPPVEVPDGWAWLWWVLGIICVAALLILAWRWWQRKQVQPLLTPHVPAHVRARQELEQALAFMHDPRLFCIRVSGTIRFYLEERFDFRAPERTTEEFLLELQTTELLTPDQKQSLGEFLQSCDLVKFARYEPPEIELRALYDAALRLIDETQYDSIDAPPQSMDGHPPLLSRAATEDGHHVP